MRLNHNTTQAKSKRRNKRCASTRSSQRRRCGERDKRSLSGGQELRDGGTCGYVLCCVVLYCREAVVSLINADENRVDDSMSTRR